MLIDGYVFIKINEENIIVKVKIINGEQLSKLDNTGTLTKKYQATMPSLPHSMLFTEFDSKLVQEWCDDNRPNLSNIKPTDDPIKGRIIPIKEIYEKLKCIEGMSIPHLNMLQERNRGAELHKLICQKLGYKSYEDDGSYPDIRNQLIEIKLQMSPTIDLGLHSPEENELISSFTTRLFHSNDIRYIIANGVLENNTVRIRHIYVVNGQDFSKNFPLFKGKIKNAKLQIPLSNNFFD